MVDDCRTSHSTAATTNMNSSNSSSLGAGAFDDEQQRFKAQSQSGGEETSSSAVGGGGHILPGDISARALAAMALGMDVNSPAPLGSSPDGTSSSYTTAQQAWFNSSGNMSSPSPVDSHVANNNYVPQGQQGGGSYSYSQQHKQQQGTTVNAGFVVQHPQNQQNDGDVNMDSSMSMGMLPNSTRMPIVGQQANTTWDSNNFSTSTGVGNGMTTNIFNQGQGQAQAQAQFVQQLVPSASQLLQQSTTGANMSAHRQASSMSIGDKINADTTIGSVDDGLAAFTAQDEQLELATVSPTELADADTDLRGIIPLFDGLSMAAAVSGSASNPGLAADADQHVTTAQLHQLSAVETQSHLEHIGPALLRLDQEIAALPPQDKVEYLTAMRRCPPTSAMANANAIPGIPQEPWDCYRTAYLEREGYDAAAAAQKLCKYWRIKQSVFGAEAYCPHASTGPTGTGEMTLAQCFSQSELASYMDHSPFHVLEERDGAGRAILFLDPNRRDLVKFPTNSAMKSLFYMFQILTLDPVVRRRGFVMIANMKIPSKKYDRSSIRSLLPFIYGNLPLRCRGLHLVNPSAVSYYVVFPVIKYFLGREMRLRTKTHYGGSADTARSLAEFRLFSNVVPVEVGGTVVVNRQAWLANRLMLEGGLIRQCQQRYQLQQQQQQLQQTAQRIEQDLSGMGYNLADFEPDPIGAVGPSPGHVGSSRNLMDGADPDGFAYARSGRKRGSESEYAYSDEVAQEVFTGGRHELKKRRSEGELNAGHAIDQEIESSEEGFGGSAAFSLGSNVEVTASMSSQSQMDAAYNPILQAIASAPSGTNDEMKSRKKNKKKAKAKKTGDGSASTKGGRQSDPRMIAAIEAKSRDNSLSLREALEIGGFQFPETQGRCAAATVLDSDGVSLAQRKNQLSRRLRQIKSEEAEKGEGDGVAEIDAGQNYKGSNSEEEEQESSNSSMKRIESMDSSSDMVSNLPSINTTFEAC